MLDSCLEVLRPFNNCYEQVIDDHTDGLVNKALNSHETVAMNIAMWSKRLPTQIRSHTFDEMNPKYFSSFYFAIKLACDLNGIQEGAGM